MILEGFRADVKTAAPTKLRRRSRDTTTAALVRAEACAVRGGACTVVRCADAAVRVEVDVTADQGLERSVLRRCIEPTHRFHRRQPGRPRPANRGVCSHRQPGQRTWLGHHRQVQSVRLGVAVPIMVEGRLCGMVAASWGDEPLQLDTECRLCRFADPAAVAISSAKALGDLRELVDEQAVWRRSGLSGLSDRVRAAGGMLTITSAAGSGTRRQASLAVPRVAVADDPSPRSGARSSRGRGD
jgi:hypothetical protein